METEAYEGPDYNPSTLGNPLQPVLPVRCLRTVLLSRALPPPVIFALSAAILAVRVTCFGAPALDHR
jgi:hypothetical protein